MDEIYRIGNAQLILYSNGLNANGSPLIKRRCRQCRYMTAAEHLRLEEKIVVKFLRSFRPPKRCKKKV